MSDEVLPGSRRAMSGRGSNPPVEEPSLVVVKQQPLNAETPQQALTHARTPAAHFYLRSHFPEPDIAPEQWRLEITGNGPTLVLTIEELRRLPALTIEATLECAGNDRIGLVPLPKGEPWGGGAVSTGRWRGASLLALLAQADIGADDVEVLFEGADSGTIEGVDGKIPFARSLPLAKALDPDVLLAYEFNDAPLPPLHGGPVRLLVPDWYGMASVKWLQRIIVLRHPFQGHFQTDSYVFRRPGLAVDEPLGAMRVKSIMTDPLPGASLRRRPTVISGQAWSGSGSITRVEVAIEGEGEWHPARLVGPERPHAWRRWEWEWEPARTGRFGLRVRAWDEHGNSQPDVPEWNRFGYGNNAIQLVIVQICDP